MDGPSRIIVVQDSSGRLHGRIEWVALEMDEAFNAALEEFCAAVIALP
jgi:hypothetical protein